MKVDFDQVPSDVYEYIVQLRKEAAKYRAQRREAVAERDALATELRESQLQVASLMLDVADLREGIDPRSGIAFSAGA